jgi:TubC N-terminal docking domain
VTAPELLAFVDRSGGRVWLEGGRLKYRLPDGRTDLLEVLKAHKPTLIATLTANPWEQADAHAAQIVTAMQSKSLEYAQLLYQDGDGWHTLPHAGAVWGIQSAAQFLEATRYARTRQPHPSAVEVRAIRKGSRLEIIETFQASSVQEGQAA